LKKWKNQNVGNEKRKTMPKVHRELRYSQYVDDIDLDALYDALGWTPFENRRGEDVGHCPDLWGMHKHGDTTGKFAINRDKKVFHCWVCGGGNLLSLVMEWEHFDMEEATEWLYQFAQGGRTGEVMKDIDALYARLQEHRADTIPHFNVHVLDQFEISYMPWFEKRGISREIVHEFDLRWAERHKKSAPLRNGEKIDDDYFGPCVIFPHTWQGDLVGWQHRWLDHGTNTPQWLGKYTNTMDFPKEQTVYNYDRALAKKRDPVVLVESVPTVLFLESHGIPAVSCFGGQIKSKQMNLLRSFDQIYIAADNDKVGDKFVEAAVEGLSKSKIALFLIPTVTIREGADLGDIATDAEPKDHGKILWGFIESAEYLGGAPLVSKPSLERNTR